MWICRAVCGPAAGLNFCPTSRLEEGYPRLVAQGPFIATLMLDHFLRQHPGVCLGAFTFRAVSPFYDGEELALEYADSEDGFRLRPIGPEGVIMTGTVELAQ